MASMMECAQAAKRGLRDHHNFIPTGGTKHDPLFAEGAIPDGEYTMTLDGVQVTFKVINGGLNFERLDERLREAKRQQQSA